MPSCLVSVYSHLHWTLFPPLSPSLCVYIIPLIDFWLDYLSPTYSSQIRRPCSSYPQSNRLEGRGEHSQTKCNEYNAYWGEKPSWIVRVCVELMGNFQLDKAWVIQYACGWKDATARELVGVIYISASHCLRGPRATHKVHHTLSPRERRCIKYKHSFGNNA